MFAKFSLATAALCASICTAQADVSFIELSNSTGSVTFEASDLIEVSSFVPQDGFAQLWFELNSDGVPALAELRATAPNEAIFVTACGSALGPLSVSDGARPGLAYFDLHDGHMASSLSIAGTIDAWTCADVGPILPPSPHLLQDRPEGSALRLTTSGGLIDILPDQVLSADSDTSVSATSVTPITLTLDEAASASVAALTAQYVGETMLVWLCDQVVSEIAAVAGIDAATLQFDVRVDRSGTWSMMGAFDNGSSCTTVPLGPNVAQD